MKYHQGMIPEPTVLDRLLEISELFQRDMARVFDGTSLSTAPTLAKSSWRSCSPVSKGRLPT